MEWVPRPSGKRGRQQHFSDAAIQTCLTLKVLFGMPLRQTPGFVQSLLQLVGLDYGAGLQHSMLPSKNAERQPALSRGNRSFESLDRQHGDQSRR